MIQFESNRLVAQTSCGTGSWFKLNPLWFDLDPISLWFDLVRRGPPVVWFRLNRLIIRFKLYQVSLVWIFCGLIWVESALAQLESFIIWLKLYWSIIWFSSGRTFSGSVQVEPVYNSVVIGSFIIPFRSKWVGFGSTRTSCSSAQVQPALWFSSTQLEPFIIQLGLNRRTVWSGSTTSKVRFTFDWVWYIILNFDSWVWFIILNFDSLLQVWFTVGLLLFDSYSWLDSLL